MKNVLKLSFLCLFLVAAACSKKSSGANTGQFFLFDSPEIAKMVFSLGRITCTDTSQCSDSAGGLSTFTAYKKSTSQISYEVGVCSMTLVAPNLILTNRHCVPADLRKKGATCLNRMKFRFPLTTNYRAESFDCTEVVEISRFKNDDTADIDWALIRLRTNSIRPVATANPAGIEFNKAVILFPIEYTLREVNDLISTEGEMQRVTCETNPSNPIFGGFVNKLSAIFIADDCTDNIIHGNSGSGIFNVNNELVGVGSFGVDDPLLPQNLFGGTNLTCIPYFNANPSAFCKVP